MSYGWRVILQIRGKKDENDAKCMKFIIRHTKFNLVESGVCKWMGNHEEYDGGGGIGFTFLL